MMRKFMVNVNGTSYEVMVEEIGGAAAPAASGRAPAPRRPVVSRPAPAPVVRPAAPAPAAAPAAPAAAPVAVGDGTAVNSPMSGNILDVKVKVGDAVNAGDVLLVLEAMKMENEITAPCAGTVKSLAAVKGNTVTTGDILAVIG